MVGNQTHQNQIQVIRGGEEGQEDLVGDEWRGGEEEGGRKETFLWGAEAQETHCSWRHQGVQVKIDGSQMANLVVTADHPFFPRTASCGFTREKSPNPLSVQENGTLWKIFNDSNYLRFHIYLGRWAYFPFACCLRRKVSLNLTDQTFRVKWKLITVCACVFCHFPVYINLSLVMLPALKDLKHPQGRSQQLIWK